MGKIILGVTCYLILSWSCTTSRSITAVPAITKAQSHKLLDDWIFLLEEFSDDSTYGYSSSNPVNVGGGMELGGVKNQRRFLNALAGPNGEEIGYHRLGSCCSFKCDDCFMGMGMLDMYKLEWEGQADTIILYLNLYTPGELLVPVGLTIREFW